MPAVDERDRVFLREAIELAREGRYSVSPNPAVGCILVRDGEVVGHGFHARAGEGHAEVVALAAAGARAQGATAYVTLEPCNHHGRTGPCSEALIAAGIARVVYGPDDPNPAVNGSGAARLRAAGVEVHGGVEAVAARAVNAGFFQRMLTGRPRVVLKIAMSLDGATALASGESQWITGPVARAAVQGLRAAAGAVVTGIGTVLADDPRLDVRDPAYEVRGRQPWRVVLDSALRTPPTARLFDLAGPVLILGASVVGPAADGLRAAGGDVRTVSVTSHGLDLGAVLDLLGELPVNDVLVEAGPTLAGRFLAAGLVDELVVHLAPKLLGRTARRAFEIASPARLADAYAFDLVSSTRLGDDMALVFHAREGSGTGEAD
ncbi:MAG: bifunctional diaminohydroxyphosphoribosylaminopyrimidine deaminase/5-amino-6-(5-phosphoribosylamino)uracil reductase RibD [Gammaproteobacteria bacterium]